MPDGPVLLDTVALLRDAPELGLLRGQVGTVVDDAGGDQILVEFVASDGSAMATPTLARADLLVLRGVPLAAE